MALQDKVAIVTGSSSGIGAEIARAFSREGAKVVITARSLDKLQAVAAQCSGGTSNVHIVAGDITDEGVQKQIVSEAVETFGGIDILVNNAGTVVIAPVDHGTDFKNPDMLFPFESTEVFGLETYDKQFNINMRQIVGITSLAVPHIVKKKGNIVNISSTGGKRAFAGSAFHCMSKAALDMMTACLCVELGPLGVRVNSINPGYIKTEILDTMGITPEQQSAMMGRVINMHALKRAGETSEVADAAVYLASAKAGFVTGSSLFVDGGSNQMLSG